MDPRQIARMVPHAPPPRPRTRFQRFFDRVDRIKDWCFGPRKENGKRGILRPVITAGRKTLFYGVLIFIADCTVRAGAATVTNPKGKVMDHVDKGFDATKVDFARVWANIKALPFHDTGAYSLAALFLMLRVGPRISNSIDVQPVRAPVEQETAAQLGEIARQRAMATSEEQIAEIDRIELDAIEALHQTSMRTSLSMGWLAPSLLKDLPIAALISQVPHFTEWRASSPLAQLKLGSWTGETIVSIAQDLPIITASVATLVAYAIGSTIYRIVKPNR